MFLKVLATLLAVFLALTSAGLAGGWVDADANRKDVQDALQFAVAQHNKASNDMFVSQVSRVIKVQTQVVSGINYRFTVEMVRTACRKADVKEVCAAHPDESIAKPHECQIKVYNQSWTNTIKVTKNTCQ
ncbi:cystatin C precursor [Silurus asotus]|uniref:Cystatin C n=1 Tax=Silurus asotus TaxID=30991 RepID=A0AAD5A996_SILAS|nr:cystatin C precursor [Silurus asotus]